MEGKLAASARTIAAFVWENRYLGATGRRHWSRLESPGGGCGAHVHRHQVRRLCPSNPSGPEAAERSPMQPIYNPSTTSSCIHRASRLAGIRISAGGISLAWSNRIIGATLYLLNSEARQPKPKAF